MQESSNSSRRSRREFWTGQRPKSKVEAYHKSNIEYLDERRNSKIGQRRGKQTSTVCIDPLTTHNQLYVNKYSGCSKIDF